MELGLARNRPNYGSSYDKNLTPNVVPRRHTTSQFLLCGRLEGMIIDPVYEGKSMAGLIDLVAQGEIEKDSKVLYAHLGGQPALNAYSGIFG